MKVFIRTLWIMLFVGAGFMAGMLVDGSDFFYGLVEGRLYALYVLIYTGGAFMAGLWFGQRWERRWEERQDAVSEDAEPAAFQRNLDPSTDSSGRELGTQGMVRKP